MAKLLKIFAIFFAFLKFSLSNPTTIFPDYFEVESSETPTTFNEEKLAENPSDHLETQEIYTGPYYEMIITVSGKFNEEFKDKNSRVFKKFSSGLDAELIYTIESAFDNDTVPIGTFEVKNILPSNLEGYLYTSVLVKVSEDNADKWEKQIKRKIEEEGNLVEMEVKSQGYSWTKVNSKDLWMYQEHTECMSGK